MRCPPPTSASAFVVFCACFGAAALPASAQTVPGQSAALRSASQLTPRPLTSGQFTSGQFTSGQFTSGQRLRLFEQTATDPVAWLAPGFDAALSMAHPPRRQPPDWSVGANGFAHLYAGALARQSAATTAQFAVAALLHEDTRYRASRRGNPLRRAAHAASFTLVDRGSSGGRRLAVSSLAAAFTAAALANTWQPPQFQNSTHLMQRTLTSLAALSGSTLAAEFRPDAVRVTHRLAHRLSSRRDPSLGPRHSPRRSR